MSRGRSIRFLRRPRLSGPALLALALSGGALAGCGASETVEPQVPAFEREILAWLEEETGEDVDRAQLKVGYIDLDEDGGDEAFALYFHEDNCRETACRGWIFQRRLPAQGGGDEDDEDALRRRLVLVGEYASFVLPVASRERSTRGWRDVIVRDPATGRDDRLRFDGTAYR